MFQISEYSDSNEKSRQVVKLLREVYLGEGYSSEEFVQKYIKISELLKMGILFIASSPKGKVVATVILALAEHGNRQIAESDEGEIRLLAVASEYRKLGAGRELCLFLEKKAISLGIKKLVLSTQECMVAAQSFYNNLDYKRNQARDWKVGEKTFLAYEKSL